MKITIEVETNAVDSLNIALNFLEVIQPSVISMNQRKLLLVLLALFILSSAMLAGQQMDTKHRDNSVLQNANDGATFSALDDSTPKINNDPLLSAISVDEATIAPQLKRLEISPNATHPILEQVNQDLSGTYSDMAMGNFTNDAIPDLITVSNSESVLLIDGITGNTFDTINIAAAYSVATGEFTGDSFDDIVIASNSGSGNIISVYNGKDRNLIYSKQYGSQIILLETGTFNLLQQDDIVFLLGNGDVVFLEGATGSDLYLTIGVGGGAGLVADVTSDGVDDVILSQNVDLWVINGSDGQIIDDVVTGVASTFLAATDVTGDGKAEIIYHQSSNLIVYNVATSTNVYNVLFDSNNIGIKGIATAELSGDSINDIVVGLQNGTIVSLYGNNGTILATSGGNGGNIQALQTGNFDSKTGKEIVVGTEQAEILYLNGSNLVRLHTGILDENGILDLRVADFNNDSVDDIVVAGAVSPTILTFLHTDNHAPVVNYVELPRVRTTDTELSFSIYFDEPSIDIVSFSYSSITGGIQTINVDQPSTKLLNFRIFSQERKVSFWFHLNDTFGFSTDVGTISDPYSISLFDDQVWSSQKIEGTRFTDIAFLKISNNGVKDVVGMSGTGILSFINGTTGELLYTSNGLNDYGGSGFMEIVDFNSDGTDDVILASDTTPGGLVVIDGSTGLDIATQSDGTIYRGLVTGDLISGGNIDVAVLSDNTISFFGQNLVPEGSIDSNLIGNGVELKKLDYNNDGKQDLVVIGENANLLVFDGLTKDILLNFDMTSIDNNIVDYDQLVIGDINNDNIDDIAGKTTADPDIGHIFAINGNSGIEGELLFSVAIQGDVTDLNLADYNNDNQLDVVGLTNYGPQDRPEITIISASGEILYDDTITGLTSDIPLAGNIALADVSRDGCIDFILQLDSGIYVSDGRTGGLLEVISEDNQAQVGNVNTKNRPQLLVEDTDNNGLLEIAYIQQNQIVLRQSLYAIKSLRPIITMKNDINQTAGPKQIFLQLLDFYGDPVVDASASLLLTRANDTIRNTLATIINKDGLYQATLSPESYDIGLWNMMPIIDHPIYQNIRPSNYEDQKGNLVPFYQFGVRGVLDPSYFVSSKGAYFDAQTGLVSGVVEGNQIQLKVTVQDVYAHKIGYDAVNISVEFAGKIYQGQYPNAPHIMELTLNTTGITFGLYNITIRYNGNYVYGSTDPFLTIDLVPQQPKLDLSPTIIVGIALISFLFFSFVLKQQNDIYSSLGTDPGEVYSSIRSAIFAMIILLVIFVGLGVTVGVGAVSKLLTPLVSFIILLAALLIVLILVLMWHFRSTLKQYYALEYKMRSIFFTLFLSIVVGVLLAAIIIFGSQVEWIRYQMQLNTITFPIVNITIPQIIWQITVTGFLTGFLYILFLDSYDTYSDIKELLEIETKVLDGYYPKEPTKLYDSITIEAKSTFISLSKGFLLWYGVILWSVINNLKLIGIVSTPLLAFVLPFLIASSIFFKNQLLAIIGISDTKNSLDTDTKI